MYSSRRIASQLLSLASKRRLQDIAHKNAAQGYCTHLTYCRLRGISSNNYAKKSQRHFSTFEIEEEVLESFAKDLFVAKIKMDWIFPFPSFDTSKELNDFNDSILPLQEFLSSNRINSAKMDEDAEIHPDLMKELKNLGLFGMMIPEELGGLGLTNLKYARFAEEIAAADLSVYMTLACHNLLGVQPVLTAGNEEQKNIYFPKLASGEMITAFCLNEISSGSDITMMRARATLSDDKSHWILNGEKTSVNNGGIADLLIVFAKTEVVDVNNEKKDTITAFLVEKDSGGIYIGPQEDKMGMRALNCCDIMFDGTIVPAGNVLGEIGDGFKIATETVNNARLGLVSGVIGPMRGLVNGATEYSNLRKQFGKPLREYELVREKVFLMSQRIYAMESMTYLTLGKMDQAIEESKTADLSVEYAIAKIYCSEEAFNNSNNCMQLIGYHGYLTSFPYERMFRDIRLFQLAEGNNDVLRLYIALACIQHMEGYFNDRLRRTRVGSLRERITFFSDILRDHYGEESRNQGIFRKKIPSFGFTTTHRHKTWLDPQLEECGKLLEMTVQTFHRRVYAVIQHFGNGINEQQLHLRRIADACICIYSMAAVISRCNKSLLLGLRHREHELMLAVAHVWSARRRCDHILEELKGLFMESVDMETKRVGKELIEERRYTCSHPLELQHRYVEHPKYLEQLEKIRRISGNSES